MLASADWLRLVIFANRLTSTEALGARARVLFAFRICIGTSDELTARILHGSARHFVLCSACTCQLAASVLAPRTKNYLISLTLLVDAQGIEPWTSPV